MTLSSLAKEALSKAKNDTAKAERLLAKSLPDELRDQIIAYAVHEAIRGAARSDRKQRIRAMGTPDPRRAEDMKAIVNAGIRNHLLMILPGGCLLGEASHVELEAARDVWRLNAESNARRARWCEAIIAALPTGKRVKDAFSNERLEQLSAQVGLERAA